MWSHGATGLAEEDSVGCSLFVLPILLPSNAVDLRLSNLTRSNQVDQRGLPASPAMLFQLQPDPTRIRKSQGLPSGSQLQITRPWKENAFGIPSSAARGFHFQQRRSAFPPDGHYFEGLYGAVDGLCPRLVCSVLRTPCLPQAIVNQDGTGWFTRWLWTTDDQGSTALKVTTGVWFGLASTPIERSLVHLLAWSLYGRELYRRRRRIGERERLMDHENSQRPPSYWNIFFKSLSWLIVFSSVLWAVAGAFVPTVPTEKAARSGSDKCGLWGLKDDARPAAQDADALIQGDKETRAGLYARDCYGTRSTTSLDQCLLFRDSSVPTAQMQTGQQCPFVNDTYCPGTGFTAVKFTTGLVDSTAIGINADNAPRFNRTMICSPIDIFPGLAEKTSQKAGWWGFNLGPVSSEEYSSKYTFQQYGDPFDFDVRSYTMRYIIGVRFFCYA